jgi:hypothetical protein
MKGPFWGELKINGIMGFLYKFSLVDRVVFSVTSQLLAIPYFLAVSRKVCLKPR